MEVNVENRKEKIERLMESRNLLFKSMVKFGTYTRCHKDLFMKIDHQLEDEGVYPDEKLGGKL